MSSFHDQRLSRTYSVPPGFGPQEDMIPVRRIWIEKDKAYSTREETGTRAQHSNSPAVSFNRHHELGLRRSSTGFSGSSSSTGPSTSETTIAMRGGANQDLPVRHPDSNVTGAQWPSRAAAGENSPHYLENLRSGAREQHMPVFPPSTLKNYSVWSENRSFWDGAGSTHVSAWSVLHDQRTNGASNSKFEMQRSERERSSSGLPMIEEEPLSCPICTEVLDETDSSFTSCPCGFKLCLFCHHTIKTKDGRCPGCRKAYDPDVSTPRVPGSETGFDTICN